MSQPRAVPDLAPPGADAPFVPPRLRFVADEARAGPGAGEEELVMTVPHLLLRELIAFLALSLGLVLLALFFDAPLQAIADPGRTPNPAKAPWFMLGLQELLHYYPPLVSGVLLPVLLVVALAVVPYARVNLERAPLAVGARRGTLVRVWVVVAGLAALFCFSPAGPVWPLLGPTAAVGLLVTLGLTAPASSVGARAWLGSRSLPFWIFCWFLLAATTLTAIGLLFRGPGWAYTLPWRDGIY